MSATHHTESAEGSQVCFQDHAFQIFAKDRQVQEEYSYPVRKNLLKFFTNGNACTHCCGWTLPAWVCLERGRSSSLAERQQTSINWKKQSLIYSTLVKITHVEIPKLQCLPAEQHPCKLFFG